MNAESRPKAALEDLARDRSAFYGTRLFGASVENHLDSILWRLVRGELGLHQLTPSLAAFWHLGYDDGRASLLPQLRQAEADRDRYYLRAFDTPNRRRQRLDEAARESWNEILDGNGAR